MLLPKAVIPILESVVRSPAVAQGLPLEFWRHEDHRTWIDAFMELGSALYNSELPEEDLPPGYAQIAYLFDWEAQCQFSGWHAFSNRKPTIQRTIESYDAVGLSSEAAALRHALTAWQESRDHDATTEAYSKVPHDYSVDLDRLEYLATHFVEHADSLLYASKA